MTVSYSQVTVSGYNSSPPADDGSVTASNQVLWSTIKTKLSDPLKTALESIDDNVAAAIALAETDMNTVEASAAAAAAAASSAATAASAAQTTANAAAVKANNLSDLSSASTAFSNIKQAASDSATGVIEIATQSEMESASDNGRAVTPGRAHFHPGVAKVWVSVDETGNEEDSYNVSSVSDDGTGEVTITIDENFSGSYCIVCSPQQNSVEIFAQVTTSTTGSFTILTTSEAGAQADPDLYMAAAFGDL